MIIAHVDNHDALKYAENVNSPSKFWEDSTHVKLPGICINVVCSTKSLFTYGSDWLRKKVRRNV